MDIKTEISNILPPHSLEAEQAVLGALLIDGSAWDKVAGLLHVDEFYNDQHRRIFGALEYLFRNNKPTDVLTVAEALEGKSYTRTQSKNKKNKTHEEDLVDIKASEILPYLGELAGNTPTVAHVQHYAEIVRNRAILRKLIGKANEIVEKATHLGSGDAKELLDDIEREIFSISESMRQGSQDFVRIGDLMKSVKDRLTELSEREDNSELTGLSTGLSDIDYMTTGFQNGDLIIIAARPSMGKTSLALNIAEHVATHPNEGGAVAIFSLEMSCQQIATRMLGSMAKISMGKLRSGRLSDDDWDRFGNAHRKLAKASIYIDDQSSINVLELRARARRLYRKVGQLHLIIIDYLQLMSGTTRGGESNRVQEITEISRGLKGLARELNVPVIALSQLNRATEKEKRKPRPSDLRESGSIEQDADLIFFIHRDDKDGEEKTGPVELILSKQRNGPTGSREVMFLAEFTRFENLAKGPEYSYQKPPTPAKKYKVNTDEMP